MTIEIRVPGAPSGSPFFWANLGLVRYDLPEPRSASKEGREPFDFAQGRLLRRAQGRLWGTGLISEQWPDTFIQLSDIPRE